MEDLGNANRGDIVILHACAHNPTGVDPTLEQWEQIADLCSNNGLLPWFDSAYQGYASGDLARDAGAVRMFERKGLEFVIAQSFAKNMGLYGERAGCCTVVSRTQEQAKAVQTQLNAVIRPMYSNPPKHGMYIAKRILENEGNFNAWVQELQMMSGRIIEMRQALRNALEKRNTPGSWNHITDQIGMFSFTGLTPQQVEYVIVNHHVYMLSNGRISMAGVNTKNVDTIAAAFDDAIRNA
jgi:aspartate aminotransferase